MLTYDRALSLRIEEEKKCLIYIFFFHRPPSTSYLNILICGQPVLKTIMMAIFSYNFFRKLTQDFCDR